MTQRKIIFVHQAKSGGTTLVQSFRDTYGRPNVYLDTDAREIANLPRWRKKLEMFIQPYRSYKDRAPCNVIHGHFNIRKYKRAFPDAFFITFYRDPVQRIISAYLYWLRTPHLADTNPLCRWLHAERPSLVDFVRRASAGDEHYCKLFGPDQFDFVGITERQDESMQLLKMHIPELKIDVTPQRVNPEKKAAGESYQLKDDEAAELAVIMKGRMALYNAAVHRFELDLTRFMGAAPSASRDGAGR